MFELPSEIKTALRTLADAGYEAYVVGGAVRSMLMAQPVHDYDITTSATPEQMREVFSGYAVIPTGEKHGTLTVIIGEYPIEITVYRSEGAYSDGRHPDSVSCAGTLADDLQRRDFTMNAVAYSPDAGFFDPFHGADDIKNGLVRCVGDPCARLSEDYLRILRAVRFCSTLDFSVEERTEAAVHKYADRLMLISSERVFSELCRLLCGKNAGYALREFSDCIFEIIPELSVMYGYDQNNPNHCYDLYEHTVRCVTNVEPDLPLRLAALLHDSGKPTCKTTDERGVSHYRGHPEVSERIAREVLLRLRAPNALIQRVCTLVKYHDTRLKPQLADVRKLMNKIGADETSDVLKLQRADSLSQSPEYYYRLETNKELYNLFCEVKRRSLAVSIADLAVNGDDLLALGIPKGQAIGSTLNALLDDVISERVENTKEALLNAALKLI